MVHSISPYLNGRSAERWWASQPLPRLGEVHISFFRESTRCDTWLHLASVPTPVAPHLALTPQPESPFVRLLMPPCVTTVHKTCGEHARLNQCGGLRSRSRCACASSSGQCVRLARRGRRQDNRISDGRVCAHARQGGMPCRLTDAASCIWRRVPPCSLPCRVSPGHRPTRRARCT